MKQDKKISVDINKIQRLREYYKSLEQTGECLNNLFEFCHLMDFNTNLDLEQAEEVIANELDRVFHKLKRYESMAIIELTKLKNKSSK